MPSLAELTVTQCWDVEAVAGAVGPDTFEIQRTRPILDQIANKWSVLILTVVCEKPSRFNEIMRRLDGITHKALAEALKRLQRNGLISREVLPTTPVGVEYRLTPLGMSLKEPFAVLYDWALTHGDELKRARAEYDQVPD